MPKRVLQGVVVSDKQDKTVVVKVERRFTHPVMKKTVRRTKNYHAHDEANTAKVGDIVSIQESRPHSKLKTWELVPGGGEGGGEGLIGSIVSTVKSAVGLSNKG
jgi:small subunit ribosomal protein S17